VAFAIRIVESLLVGRNFVYGICKSKTYKKNLKTYKKTKKVIFFVKTRVFTSPV